MAGQTLPTTWPGVEPDTTIGQPHRQRRAVTGIPVVVGQTYTHSIDLRAEQDNRRAISYFSWYDDAWAGKGDSSDVSAWTNLVNGVAARISHTATAPAGATKCLVIVAIYTIGGTGNALAGERAWWDNLRLCGCVGCQLLRRNTRLRMDRDAESVTVRQQPHGAALLPVDGTKAIR